MTNINLLPRKQYRLNKQQSNAIIYIAAIICAFTIIFIAHLVIQNELNILNSRVSSYREEMQSYRNASSEAQTNSIEVYQEYLQQTENLFSMLSMLPNHAICLTEISRTRDKVTLAGEMRSAADLGELIKEWTQTSHFKSVRIVELAQLSETRSLTYRLHLVESSVPPQSMAK